MTSGLHSTAIVDAGAKMGSGVEIGAFCVVGPDVSIDDNVRLHNNVTVTGNVRLCEGAEIFPNAVIGAAPQILGFSDNSRSRVEIGARTILRENVTVHAGSGAGDGLTSIGEDCMLMANSHVAHDCRLGDRCVIANGTQIGGHVKVGAHVWMGGLVAVHQYCQIGQHAFVGGGAILVDDVIPYGSVIGNHAHLAGLNIVGLKRRGFPDETLKTLRLAWRDLFCGEGLFAERLSTAAEKYTGSPEVMDMISFIQADRNRALCRPK